MKPSTSFFLLLVSIWAKFSVSQNITTTLPLLVPPAPPTPPPKPPPPPTPSPPPPRNISGPVTQTPDTGNSSTTSPDHGEQHGIAGPIKSNCSLSDFHFVVEIIRFIVPVQKGILICVGNIITEEWILTTADCISTEVMERLHPITSNDTRFYVFTNNHTSFNEHRVRNQGILFEVKRRILHPDFSFGLDFKNNIGLVQTAKKITLGAPVTIAQLSTKPKGWSNMCTEGIDVGNGPPHNLTHDGNTIGCSRVKLTGKSGVTVCDFKESTLPEMLQLPIILADYKVNRLYAISDPAYPNLCTRMTGSPLVCQGRLIGIMNVHGKKDICNVPKGTCWAYVNLESYFSFISEYTKLKLPNWKPTDREYMRPSWDSEMENGGHASPDSSHFASAEHNQGALGLIVIVTIFSVLSAT